MRAIVLDRPGSFRVAQVPDPVPGMGQVIVRVDACGICGTDIHILDGEFPPTRTRSRRATSSPGRSRRSRATSRPACPWAPAWR